MRNELTPIPSDMRVFVDSSALGRMEDLARRWEDERSLDFPRASQKVLRFHTIGVLAACTAIELGGRALLTGMWNPGATLGGYELKSQRETTFNLGRIRTLELLRQIHGVVEELGSIEVIRDLRELEGKGRIMIQLGQQL